MAQNEFHGTAPPDKSVYVEIREFNHLDRRISSITSSGFTSQEKKRIIHHVDRRLVLTLGTLYAVSLMDRTNTGIAFIAGMGTDLEMTSTRYSLVVLLFFIPYVMLQPVATVMMRKIGPNIFLSATTLIWGMVTIASGFVNKWWKLIPLRIALGTCEAGFFPGCAYLLSCWYPRYALQKRNAAFYLIGTMASAFSGILAFGFSQLGGIGSGPSWWAAHQDSNDEYTVSPNGIAAWRWIFIMQGVLTCCLAIISYVVIVGFPESLGEVCGLSFLAQQEAAFVVARIDRDRHDAAPEEFDIRMYLRNALDLKIWCFAALFGMTTINTYGIAFYLPVILKDGMGFGTAASQCLVSPPYVAAAIVMFAVAYCSDRFRLRSPFIFANTVILLCGLVLLGFTQSVAVRYTGAFLATIACNSNVPCLLTWQANNIRGQWKRAFCSATLVGSGGVGGIVGSLVFRESESPTYRTGIYASIASGILTIVVTGLLRYKFVRANRRAAAGEEVIEGLIGFRYTL